MRKPDPPPGSEPMRRKRSSVARTSTHKPSSSSSTATDPPQDVVIEDDPRTAQFSQASQTTMPSNGDRIDTENFPISSSRPGSAAAMYSPGPPTRTTGSTSSLQSTTTAASSSTSGTGLVELIQRSRSRIVVSDDDSEGADADSEHGKGGHIGSNPLAWSNVNSRRRGLPKRTAATAAVAALEDIRRHSMVI